ncbi:MAG: DegV family protein [Clostridia bacterium]|nr:DegV family protein [Clostridia bacterium]
MKPVIITDSCSDLPIEFVQENNIEVLGLNVYFKGKEFQDDLGQTLKYDEFYNAVRDGELPSTSQITSPAFTQVFEKYVSKGNPIIYIGFSSALSGSVNSAHIAKNAVMEKFKNADITIIDTKSASLGEGLIVHYAYDMLNRGCLKEEIVDWIENNKLKVNHWFTVSDLNHLKRGGRVSSVAATLGTLLNIKPILHVDHEGRLIPVTRVKGRRKSIKALADMFREKAVNPEKQVVAISHGDCIEDAKRLKETILKDHKVKKFIINHVGPGIGSHSGPDTLALFFMGDRR